MNNIGSPPTKRMRLSGEELNRIPKEEIIELYIKQQELLEERQKPNLGDKESGEKSKLAETSRRENVLVMRLATKEQELQQYAAQIAHIKKLREDTAAKSLHEAFLDPAVNLLFNKMKNELKETKDKLEQAQSELSAWKFTPDSQTGKKLMSRCRTLIAENQELGRQLSQGRVAQLEAELALQKKYSEDLKESQEELNEFVIQLDEEVEGMQSTIQMLQQQLTDAKKELEKFKNLAGDIDLEEKPRTSDRRSNTELALKVERELSNERKENISSEAKQALAKTEVGENGIIDTGTPNGARSPDERSFENSEFVCKEECETDGENSGNENGDVDKNESKMEVDGGNLKLSMVEGPDQDRTPVYSEHEIIDESQDSTPIQTPERDSLENEGEIVGTDGLEPASVGSAGRDESPMNEETYAVIDNGSDEETEHVVQIVSTHEEDVNEVVADNNNDKAPQTPDGDFIETLDKQESLDYDETEPDEDSAEQPVEQDVAAGILDNEIEDEDSEIETRTTELEAALPEASTMEGESSSLKQAVDQSLNADTPSSAAVTEGIPVPIEASHVTQGQPQPNSKDVQPISLNGPMPTGLPPPIAHSMMAPAQVPLMGDPSAYLMNPHFQHMSGAALAQQQVLIAEQASLMYKTMLAQQQQQQQQQLAMAEEKNAHLPESGNLPKSAEELRTPASNPLMHGLPFADPQAAAFLAQYKAMLAAQPMFVPGPDGKTQMIAPGGLGLYPGLPLVQPPVMAAQPNADHGPVSIPSSWPSTTMTYSPNPLMAPGFLGPNPAGMMLYPGHNLTPQPVAASPAPVEMDKHHGSGDHGPIPNGIPAQKTQEHADTNPPKEEPQMVA